MGTVEKAHAGMFDEICRFMVEGVRPGEAPALIDRYYRPIFEYRWEREEDSFGHVLLDRGTIAGFVGAFFVRRPVAGTLRRFCNLTTWKVREGNRSESILLLLPFLRMKGYTVTGRTAARNIFAIHQKLGFRYLDDRAILVLTFAGDLGKGVNAASCREGDFPGILSGGDLRLVEDHAPYKCHPVVLKKNGRYLLFFVTFPKKWGITVAFVQHINDLDLFLELLPKIKREMSRRFQTPFLWIEKRFLRGRKIPFSREYRSRFVHLYKSEELTPEQIDNLYTEIVVFNTLENRFY